MKTLKITQFAWMVLLCCLIVIPFVVHAENQEEVEVEDSTITSAPVEYKGIYKKGDAPLKKKTKVRIVRAGDFFEFIPKSGETWALSVKSIRGTNAVEKGIWIYWFSEAGDTLTAYIETKDNLILKDDINAAVEEANRDPNVEYRARYETYKSKALEEAK